MLKERLKELYPALAPTFDYIVSGDSFDLMGKETIIFPYLKANLVTVMEGGKMKSVAVVGYNRRDLLQFYEPEIELIALFTYSKYIYVIPTETGIKYRRWVTPQEEQQLKAEAPNVIKERTYDIACLHQYGDVWIPVLIEGRRSKYYLYKSFKEIRSKKGMEGPDPVLVKIRAKIDESKDGNKFGNADVVDVLPCDICKEDSRVPLLASLVRDHTKYRLGLLQQSPLLPGIQPQSDAFELASDGFEHFEAKPNSTPGSISGPTFKPSQHEIANDSEDILF